MKRFYFLSLAAAAMLLVAAPSFSQAVDSPAARDTGLLVVRVLPDTPAFKAGIIRGDIITALDGSAVTTVVGINKLLADRKAGQTVTLTLFRGESVKTIPVILEDRLFRPALGLNLLAAIAVPGDIIGQAEERQSGENDRILPILPGVSPEAKIMEVVRGSPADKAGLKVGERISAVNEIIFDGKADLAEIIGQHKAGDEINLSVFDAKGLARRVVVVLDEVDGKVRLGVSYRMVVMNSGNRSGVQGKALEKQIPRLLDKLPDLLNKRQNNIMPMGDHSVL